MNILRKLVSGKRNRLKTDSYDLDISYITPRVCGMSFPASGFEKVYRNNINDVRCSCLLYLKVTSYLEETHKDNYLVFNLSCRTYDYTKFNNNVLEYKWEDHHSPELSILFKICEEMY